MRAIVFGDAPRLALRTTRACARLGLEVERAASLDDAVARAADGSEGVWLLAAGAWPDASSSFGAPPRSATGKPLAAIGALRAAPHADDDAAAAHWSRWLARTGGDATRAPLPGRVESVWLDPEAARRARDASLERALGSGALRVVRLGALDVRASSALRVVELVTSLQQGGAERVVVNLVRGLRARGAAAMLVTTGRPTRATFPAPEGTLDLGALRGDPRAQADAIERAARAFGADVVHAHLVDAATLEELAGRGLEVAVTVHNARPGWPAGLADLTRGAAPVFFGCARAVARELRAATDRPVRTAHNGITPSPREPARRAETRAAWGASAGDVVLLAVANPRPQKRLHLLGPIARAVTARTGRRAVVVLAGAPSAVHADAAACADALVAACAREGVALVTLGSVDALAPVWAAADALVSPSAWEGLSLAQLEALAAGLPVVASDVGGTGEIPGVRAVPADATHEAWAEAIDMALAGPRPSLAPELHAERAARRNAELLERVAVARRADRRGVLLVTNNFSTGGAQSSARRLLVAMRAAGVHARAAVLQEQAEWPTPGRRALEAAGVPVFAAPDATTTPAADAARAILDRVDRDPPEAVIFWNAIPEHKVLLADALVGVPVWDVSPGEMYFASLERWFARGEGIARAPRDYGALLAGVVVKYAAEVERARALGAPVHVVPNGVDLGPPPRARRDGATLVIGTSARLAPQKRLEDLLAAIERAAPRLGPFELRIAGGPETGAEAYAASLARASEGAPVRWLGETADVRGFLDGLDVFAMISEPAGCPNASLEAMAAGLPVVATDVGGAREQLEGVGVVVPPRDPAAMADALVALAGDPPRRASLGAAARARAEERFGVDRMLADWLALLGLQAFSRTSSSSRPSARSTTDMLGPNENRT